MEIAPRTCANESVYSINQNLFCMYSHSCPLQPFCISRKSCKTILLLALQGDQNVSEWVMKCCKHLSFKIISGVFLFFTGCVLGGQHFEFFFKKFGEYLGAIKSNFIGDLTNRFSAFFQKLCSPF